MLVVFSAMKQLSSPICRGVLLAGLAVCSVAVEPARATSGPGCYRIVNVAGNDVLNLRSKPSASARVVERMPPVQHGILAGTGPCVPASAALPSRWCPITYYDGDRVAKGYAKRRYLADSDCP